MKFFPILLSALALFLSAGSGGAQTAASVKKGVGLAEKNQLGARQLAALNAAWYYNWGPESAIAAPAQFVPMIFSKRVLNARIAGDYVLGFNEPDNPKQAHLPVADALADWPAVVAKAKFVGSPAMAGSPVKGLWLPAFMAAGPKVDFIAMHWYKEASARRFIEDVTAVHEKYGKPVWVTEFAPQTAASSEKSPNKFTQAQVDRFISETVHWMETTPYVERYAWHDSRAGTSALFYRGGELTPTGLAYAAAR